MEFWLTFSYLRYGSFHSTSLMSWLKKQVRELSLEVGGRRERPEATANLNPRGRRHFLGGTDARIIMSGDETSLIRLWKEKRGEAEPEDLSENLIVQLGVATETLNRSWYERNTRRVTTGCPALGSAIRFIDSMAAKLDGFVDELDAVFEAKFMLPWSFSEEAASEKHMAQLQHYMWVTNSRSAALFRSSPMEGRDDDPCRRFIPAFPHRLLSAGLALRADLENSRVLTVLSRRSRKRGWSGLST